MHQVGNYCMVNGVTFITDCSPYSNSGLFSKTALYELSTKGGRTDWLNVM